MDHQAMITHVSNELRNRKIDSLITSWLNLAIVDIANNYTFGDFNTYATASTVASNPAVTLPADFDWLKTIGIPAERRKLWPENEQRIATSYPDYRTLIGTTTHYYLNGSILGLFQVSAAVKTLGYSYQRKATALSALTDISDLPEPWHLLVAQKAITMGHRYDGSPEVNSSLLAEKILLKDLKASEYSRPDFSMTMGGSQGWASFTRIPPAVSWIKVGGTWVPS